LLLVAFILLIIKEIKPVSTVRDCLLNIFAATLYRGRLLHPQQPEDADGKITLQWILGKKGGRLWTGFIWLRTGTSSGPL